MFWNNEDKKKKRRPISEVGDEIERNIAGARSKSQQPEQAPRALSWDEYLNQDDSGVVRWGEEQPSEQPEPEQIIPTIQPKDVEETGSAIQRAKEMRNKSVELYNSALPSVAGAMKKSVRAATHGFEPTKPWEEMSAWEKTMAGASEIADWGTNDRIVKHGVETLGAVGGVMKTGQKLNPIYGMAEKAGLFDGVKELPDFLMDTSRETLDENKDNFKPKTYSEEDNLFTNPKLALNWEYWYNNTMDMVPYVLESVATGGSAMFLQEGGQAMEGRYQSRKEKGEDVNIMDAVFSASVGAINGALENVGIDSIIGRNKFLRDMVNKRVTGAVAKYLANFTLAEITNMGQEFLQEMVPIISTKVLFDEGGTWQEVLAQGAKQGATAASGALIGGTAFTAVTAGTGDILPGNEDAQETPITKSQEMAAQNTPPGTPPPPGGTPPGGEGGGKEPEKGVVIDTIFDALESGDEEAIAGVIGEMSGEEIDNIKDILNQAHGQVNETQKQEIEGHLEAIEAAVAKLSGEGKAPEKAPITVEKKNGHTVVTVEGKNDMEADAKLAEGLQATGIDEQSLQVIEQEKTETGTKKVYTAKEKPVETKKAEPVSSGSISVEEAEAQIYTELDVAEAGQRHFVENDSPGAGGSMTVIGQKSTYPSWIPETYRKKGLFEKVKKAMIDDARPKGKAGELYDLVKKEAKRRSGAESEIGNHELSEREKREIEEIEDASPEDVAQMKESFKEDERKRRAVIDEIVKINPDFDAESAMTEYNLEELEDWLENEKRPVSDNERKFVEEYVKDRVNDSEIGLLYLYDTEKGSRAYADKSKHLPYDIAEPGLIKAYKEWKQKKGEQVKPEKTQKEKIAEAVKDKPKTIKEKAAELGKKAFENGIKRIPGQDKDLLELLKGREIGEGTPIMKAWNDAWDKANLEAEVKEEPKSAITPIAEKQKYSLPQVLVDIVENNGGDLTDEDLYVSVEREGYEKLYVERISKNEVAMAHTYTQNGDLMMDPEVVFDIQEDGQLIAKTIETSPYGVKPIRPTDDFLKTWTKNLLSQGFANKPEEETYTGVEKAGQKPEDIVEDNKPSIKEEPKKYEKEEATTDKRDTADSTGSNENDRRPELSETVLVGDGGQGVAGKDADGVPPKAVSGKAGTSGKRGGDVGRNIGLAKESRESINRRIEDIIRSRDIKRRLDPDAYTALEKRLFLQYTGWGGIRESRNEDADGALTEFYTPPKLIRFAYGVLQKIVGKEGMAGIKSILEPATGVGSFIRYSPFPANRFSGSEIDEISAVIAKVTNNGAKIRREAFQLKFINQGYWESLVKGNAFKKGKEPSETYDLVITNPPYGKYSGRYASIEGTEFGALPEYFIHRALLVTNVGGYVAMVIPHNFLNGASTKGKQLIAGIGELVSAHRFPNGVFKDTGTQIGTDLVIFRRTEEATDLKVLGERENAIINKNYFRENQEAIYGITGERNGRFGKEEYVKGTMEMIPDLAADKVDDNGVKEAVIEDKKADAKTLKAQEKAKKAQDKTLGKILTRVKNEDVAIIKDTDTPQIVQDAYSHVTYNGSLDRQYAKKLSDEEKLSYFSYYMGDWYPDLTYTDSKNLFELLAELDEDKDKMSKAQYEKQKSDVLSKIPPAVKIDDIRISMRSTFWKTTGIIQSFRSDIWSMHADLFEGFDKTKVRDYLDGKALFSKSENPETVAYIKKNLSRVSENVFRAYLEKLKTKNKTLIESAERTFNTVQNAFYTPDRSGVPLISQYSTTFRGEPFRMNKAQRDAIGFAQMRRKGIFALDVGVGKTITGIISTMELFKKGLAKRSLVVVPSQAHAAQWINEISGIVDEVNVYNLTDPKNIHKLEGVTPDEKSFIFVTPKGLEALGLSEDNINDLVDELQEVFDYKANTSQEIAEARQKIEGFIGEATSKSSRTVTFDSLGIDHMTIDEAHNYNKVISGVPSEIDPNTGKKSRNNQYKSLQITPSKRGIKAYSIGKLLMKKNRGQNVFLLTATPFTNNPLEYYSMLSFVGKGEMEERGVASVRDMIDAYMKVENIMTIKPTGLLGESDVITGFTNFDSFRQLLGSCMIKIDGEEAGVIRPERKDVNHYVEATQEQLDISAILAEEYEKERNLARTADKEARKLHMGNAMRAMGDLVNISFSKYAQSKFPMKKPTYKEFIEGTPKIKAICEAIRINKEAEPDANSIVHIRLMRASGASVHELTKEYLVKEVGFKESEVGIITGETSAKQRELTQKDFNAGKIRVLLGTDAITEGLNLQKRTTDIYIAIPFWNYTQFRQMAGRAWRQGNKWKTVRINLMLAKGTGDVFISSKIQQKERRERQVEKAIKRGERVYTLEGDSLDFDEIVDKLITNPVVAVQIKKEMEVGDLKSKISAYQAQIDTMEPIVSGTRKSYLENSLKNYETKFEASKKTLATYREKVAEAKEDLEKMAFQAKMESVSKETAQLRSNVEVAKFALEQLEVYTQREGVTKEKLDDTTAKKEEAKMALKKIDEKYVELMKQAHIDRANQKASPTDYETIKETIRKDNASGFFQEDPRVKTKVKPKFLETAAKASKLELSEMLGRERLDRLFNEVMKETNPIIREFAVLKMLRELDDEEMVAGYEKGTILLSEKALLTKSDDYIRGTIRHERMHLAVDIFVSSVGVRKMLEMYRALTPQERAAYFGGNEMYVWYLKHYFENYNGTELDILMAEEMLAHMAESEQSQSSVAKAVRKIFEDLVLLINRITGMLKNKAKLIGVSRELAFITEDTAVTARDSRKYAAIMQARRDTDRAVRMYKRVPTRGDKGLFTGSKTEAGMAKQTVFPDDLMAEARKYKTAEEFVRGQGEIVYRGGLPFDRKLFNSGELRGLSVTRSAEDAKDFSGNLRPADKYQGGVLSQGKKGVVEQLSIDRNAKVLSVNDAPKELRDFFYKKSRHEGAEKISLWAEKNGYDAVDFKDFEIRILNPDIVKTKSQLTDLWNQANATKTPIKAKMTITERKERLEILKGTIENAVSIAESIGTLDVYDEIDALEDIQKHVGAKSTDEDIENYEELVGDYVAEIIKKKRERAEALEMEEGMRTQNAMEYEALDQAARASGTFQEFYAAIGKQRFDRFFQEEYKARGFYNERKTRMKVAGPVVKGDGTISVANLYRKLYNESLASNPQSERISGMSRQAFTIGKRFGKRVTKENYKDIRDRVKNYIVKNLPVKERGSLLRFAMGVQNESDVSKLIGRVNRLVEIGRGKETPQTKKDLMQAVFAMALKQNMVHWRTGKVDTTMLKTVMASINPDAKKLKHMTEPQLVELIQLLESLRKTEKTGRLEVLSEKRTKDIQELLPDMFAGKQVLTMGDLEASMLLEDITGNIAGLFNKNLVRAGRLVALKNEITKRLYDRFTIAERNYDIELGEWNKTIKELYKQATGNTFAFQNKAVDDKIIDFLEGRIEADKLTEAQQALAQVIVNFYANSIEVMKPNRLRKYYFTHTRQNFLESVRTFGFARTVKDFFTAEFIQDIRKGLPDEIAANLDMIVANNVFNPFALARKNGAFTRDLRKALEAYSIVFFSKKNYDKLYRQSNSLMRVLPKNLQMYWKRYMQSSKGRPEAIPYYPALKKTLNMAVTFEYIKILGLNWSAGTTNVMFGLFTNIATQGIFTKESLIKGMARYATPKGFRMLKQYVIGTQNANAEITQYMSTPGHIFNKLAFFHMGAGEHFLRGTAFLANLTDEEWATGSVSDKRWSELRHKAGESQPLFGKFDTPVYARHSAGRVMFMFLSWLPTQLEVWYNWANGAVKVMAKEKGFEGKVIHNKDLAKLLRIVAAFILYNLAFEGEKWWEKQKEDYGRMILDPKYWLDLINPTTKPVWRDLVNALEALEYFRTQEEYRRDGEDFEKGGKKWATYLERLFTPVVVRRYQRDPESVYNSAWQDVEKE